MSSRYLLRQPGIGVNQIAGGVNNQERPIGIDGDPVADGLDAIKVGIHTDNAHGLAVVLQAAQPLGHRKDHIGGTAKVLRIGGKIHIIIRIHGIQIPWLLSVMGGNTAAAGAGAGIDGVGKDIDPKDILSRGNHDLPQIVFNFPALVQQLLARRRLGFQLLHNVGTVIGAEAQPGQFVQVSIHIQRYLLDELLHILGSLPGIIEGKADMAQRDDQNTGDKDQHRDSGQQFPLNTVPAQMLQNFFHASTASDILGNCILIID